MKKLISVCLLIAVLVSLCACGGNNQEAAAAATLDPTSPEAMYGHIDQSQKQDGVYQIWNAEGVQNFLNNPGESFQLLCNVDMGGAVIAPIGEFTGKLDGDNFTISNFTVQGGSEENFGFICVNKGELVDLVLDNVTFQPGTNAKNIGTLAGDNQGRVNRCTVGGTMAVTQAPQGANCGGLLGINSGNVQNTNTAVALNYQVPGAANIGGLVLFGLIILSVLKFSLWKKRTVKTTDEK